MVILSPFACEKNLSPTSQSSLTPTATSTPYPDWNITTAQTINAGSYNYGNVHIYSTGSLTLTDSGGAVTNAAVILNLSGDFVMDAGASVIGNSAGYGLGQGPGAGGVVAAAAGGALLRVDATSATLNGDIKVNGNSAAGGGIVTLSVHSGYYFTGTTLVTGGTAVSSTDDGANGYFTQTGY